MSEKKMDTIAKVFKDKEEVLFSRLFDYAWHDGIIHIKNNKVTLEMCDIPNRKYRFTSLRIGKMSMFQIIPKNDRVKTIVERLNAIDEAIKAVTEQLEKEKKDLTNELNSFIIKDNTKK